MQRSPRLSLVFCILVLLLRIFVSKIIFLSTVEAFDIGDVFFFFHENNIDTYCREVLVFSLSLSTIMPRTYLVVLVFFLVDGGCLLPTEYVSKKDVNRLILPRVFIFFFCWFVPLEILGINLSGI